MAGQFVNHYEVLGVSPNATLDQIRQAYHRKSRQVHPDRSSDPRANEVQQRLNHAFEILGDPIKRAEFDAMLRAKYAKTQIGHPVVPPPVHEPIPDLYIYTKGSRLRSLLRTALLVVVSLAVGGIAVAAVITAFKRPQTRAEIAARDAAEKAIEAERLLAETKLRLAKEEAKRHEENATVKRKQASALATAELKAIQTEATKTLAQLKKLESEIEAWNTQVPPLLSNERGRALAKDESDILAFEAIWNATRQMTVDPKAIRDRIEVVLRPVDEELTKPEPFFVPEDSVMALLRAEASDIEKHIAEKKGSRQQIERLLAVAEQAGRKGAVPLEQAIVQRQTAELQKKNTALAAIEKANLEKILAAESAAKRQEGEDKVKLANAKATAAKLEAAEAVAFENLLKKARAPETKQLLSFFFTPGYLQPDRSRTTEKKAYSYSKLEGAGCLEADQGGLTRLLRLMINRDDKERPIWQNSPTNYRDLTESKKQSLLAIQKALIELGPALVELKMLEP